MFIGKLQEQNNEKKLSENEISDERKLSTTFPSCSLDYIVSQNETSKLKGNDKGSTKPSD